MGIIVERTIFRTGERSFAITLPIGWVRYSGLEQGQQVEIVINDDLTVRVKRTPGDTEALVVNNDLTDGGE